MTLGLLRMRMLRSPLVALAALAGCVLLAVTFLRSDCSGSHSCAHARPAAAQAHAPPRTQTWSEIHCLVNEQTTVQCRREGPEVYLPFSFISRYFEVYGKLGVDDGYERFEFSHSYARVYLPQEQYRPGGVFMSFEHYNVEVRDRVKCISAAEGVPVSTQWAPRGHFYPIQIAQYGLSHYSKFRTEQAAHVDVLEDGTLSDKWVSDDEVKVKKTYDDDVESHVVSVTATEGVTSPGAHLELDSTDRFFISLDLRMRNNGSLTLKFETRSQTPVTYWLHYVCSDVMLTVRKNHITYGMGRRAARSWTRFSRDLAVDFHKGLAQRFRGKAKRKQPIGHLLTLTVHGAVLLDNVTLARTQHLPQFYYAANWLVLHQDRATGGWPIHVTRRLAGGRLSLDPGWHSAMAQGQAMSLLVRAFLRTRDKRYLDAAIRATHLFDIPSQDGGVLARFADKYPWYEEYPTTPSSHVLNGFVYSLIGLWDVCETAQGVDAEAARRLYRAGLTSLRALLPLFDTGSGSIYDLRHFTLGVAPNGARWDYHATHVNQLLLLSQIESKDPFWRETAQRWLGYMKGKRAPHN